ncbi:hypothetical protein MP638_006010 [Amoeboaphelidium occidentale]|nr:hypothetical protein MP638_006010 [Amoeboaphelidium occidentale]
MIKLHIIFVLFYILHANAYDVRYIKQLDEHVEISDLHKRNTHEQMIDTTRGFTELRDRILYHQNKVSFIMDAPDQQVWHLDLKLNQDLFRDDYQIYNPSHPALNNQLENCYYHGTVNGDPESMVAVSTCDGKISGQITYQGQTYDVDHNGGLTRQTVKRLEKRDNGEFCAVTEEDCRAGFERLNANILSNPIFLIKRTNRNRVFIKLLAVNDYDRVRSFGSGLERSTNDIINGVALIYARAGRSFGRQVSISIAGILNMNAPTFVTQSSGSVEAGAILDSFRVWHSSQMTRLVKHDYSQLLIGRDMYFQGSFSVSGYSQTSSMCRGDSVSVIEAREQGTIPVNRAAHELGHALGMNHDGEGSAATCSSTGFLMQRVSVIGASYGFSSCSFSDASAFLDRADISCLDEAPVEEKHCGNGVLETHLGEQCDPGNQPNPCCNQDNCMFRRSGSICSLQTLGLSGNGMCDGEGTCKKTCGNGILEPFESCDPGLLRNGCCDAVTCTFMREGSSCVGGGVCGVGGVCTSPGIQQANNTVNKTSEPPRIVTQPVDDYRAYTVAIEAPRKLEKTKLAIYFTIDGTEPSKSSSNCVPYTDKFRFSAEDLVNFVRTNKEEVLSDSLKSLLKPDNNGFSNLVLKTKGFASDGSETPVATQPLQFRMRKEELDTMGIVSLSTKNPEDSARESSSYAAIVSGAIIGALLALILVLAFVYLKKSPEEKEELKKRAVSWYHKRFPQTMAKDTETKDGNGKRAVSSTLSNSTNAFDSVERTSSMDKFTEILHGRDLLQPATLARPYRLSSHARQPSTELPLLQESPQIKRLSQCSSADDEGTQRSIRGQSSYKPRISQIFAGIQVAPDGPKTNSAVSVTRTTQIEGRGASLTISFDTLLSECSYENEDKEWKISRLSQYSSAESVLSRTDSHDEDEDIKEEPSLPLKSPIRFNNAAKRRLSGARLHKDF